MISSITFRQKYYAKSDMTLREAMLFFYLFEHYINCRTKFKNRCLSKKSYFEVKLLRILGDLDAVYSQHDELSEDIRSLWSQNEIKLVRREDKLYFRFKVKK